MSAGFSVTRTYWLSQLQQATWIRPVGNATLAHHLAPADYTRPTRFLALDIYNVMDGTMKFTNTAYAGLIAVSLSGCGTFGAAIANGPSCPYQGVHLDFATATDWQAIKSTLGLIIPLAIIDMPLSFVADTINLPKTGDASNCPRNW